MIFKQTISINNNAYSIRWGSQYLYNHEARPGGELNRLQIGFQKDSDYGPYMIIGCFTDMPNWNDKKLIISKITFSFDISSSNSFVNSLNFYKCSYVNGLGGYRGSSTQTGKTFRFDQSPDFGEGDFASLGLFQNSQNTTTFSFSKNTNSNFFSLMKDYLTSADNVQNFVFYDEDSDPNDSNCKQIGVNSITIEIEYHQGLVYYGTTTGWQPCLVYYGTSSGWQQVIPYYGTSTGWQQLGGG